MLKFRKGGEYWLAPEGFHRAYLSDVREAPDQERFAGRILWDFHLRDVNAPQGVEPVVSYWTGMSFGPKTNLNKIVGWLGGTVPETDADAEAWSPENLLGIEVMVQVKHEQGEKGPRAKIEHVIPVAALQGGIQTLAKTSQEDPFA